MKVRVSRWGCGFVCWLLVGALPHAMQAELSGTVKDRTGGVLASARVIVLTPQRAVVATTTTDKSGKFTVRNLPAGEYLIIAQYPSLAERQATATIGGTSPASVELVLDLAAIGQDVTVTASPGGIDELMRLTQPVNVITPDEVLERAKTIVAQVVDGETAVHLQRTSPGMAGIVVRGLTGNKVNIFIDGVRYSNGAQRGGVNTFLDLIDPSALEGVEVLRGTSSAQYGSDALGGSVQFLTRVPPLAADGKPTFGGSITAGGETAHQGGMGNLALAYSGERFGLLGSIAGRKTGNYRPGGGVDSHSAITRFLGLPTDDFLTERMPGTGFHQYSTQLRANYVPSSNLFFVANYLSTRQDDANRWDQLLGGDGNLIAALDDLQLDLFYARLESLKAGWFDRASVTYSLNTQREERINQGGNGNPAAPIAHEPERTTVHGVQFNASRQVSPRQSFLVGGDAYFEELRSTAFDENAVTGAESPRRPRVPDGATYRQSGFFAQTTIDAVPSKVSIIGAVRVGFNKYSASSADAPVVDGRPLWPDDSLSTTSATFRLGAAFTPAPDWTVSTAISSGYRAPHMTDLGTLGLTGSGFEVAAPDLAGMSGLVGTTADESAVSSGKAVAQVDPETSLTFDAALRYGTSRARAEFGVFVNTIGGNIQKQTLILPQGAVGQLLGTQPITSQNANGAVFVSLTTVPVLVRANFDEARIWGVEWNGEVSATPEVTIGSIYTYMRAEDTTSKLPPNIEGGTPAPGGSVWLRYMRTGGTWWVQPYVSFAAKQTHLSSLDLGDRRTGASRTRGNIQNFFRNGARARGWVNAGADGIANNADDILIATGETLAQVQDRVLGVGVNGAVMFTAVPAYTTYGVRFGVRFGPHLILLDAENLGDEPYRGISWGMDGPGRGITVRYRVKF